MSTYYSSYASHEQNYDPTIIARQKKVPCPTKVHELSHRKTASGSCESVYQANSQQMAEAQSKLAKSHPWRHSQQSHRSQNSLDTSHTHHTHNSQNTIETNHTSQTHCSLNSHYGHHSFHPHHPQEADCHIDIGERRLLNAEALESQYREPRADGNFIPETPSNKWIHKLCIEPMDGMSTCCLGFFCPCIIYGKTQHRLNRISLQENALDMTTFNRCNSSCWGWFVLKSICFSWILTSLQHSRIRAIYGIDGNAGGDYCKALFCESCTLMQHEREVYARERLVADALKCKEKSPVRNQPLPIPHMRYPSDSTSEPVVHRPSLTRAKQDNGSRYTASEKVRDIEHVDVLAQKKLHKDPKGKTKKQELIEKSGEVGDLGPSSLTTAAKKAIKDLGTTLNPLNRCTNPETEDRQAIIVSRQPWRAHKQTTGQDAQATGALNGQPSTWSKHTLAKREGNHIAAVNDHDQVIPLHDLAKCPVVEETGNANKDPGPKQHALKDCDRNNTKTGAISVPASKDNPADEAVLVYYKDEERPQRHRLADCARLRASTLGRPEIPVYEHTLANCSIEDVSTEDVSTEDENSETPKQGRLDESSEKKRADYASRTKGLIERAIDDLQHAAVLVENAEQSLESAFEPAESTFLERHNAVESFDVIDFQDESSDRKESRMDGQSDNVVPTIIVTEDTILNLNANTRVASYVQGNGTESNASNMHGLAYCETVTDADTLSSPTEQHELADCETVNGTAESFIGAEHHELADCGHASDPDGPATPEKHNDGAHDIEGSRKTSQTSVYFDRTAANGIPSHATAALRKVLDGVTARSNVADDGCQDDPVDVNMGLMVRKQRQKGRGRGKGRGEKENAAL